MLYRLSAWTIEEEPELNRRTSARLAAVALVAAALLAAGCGSSEDETPGIPQSGERITTTSTEADTTTTAPGAEDTTTTTGG
jgi:hypothetical protein